jgi:hypothetical protein
MSVIMTLTSTIKTRSSVIYTRRVWFIHVENDFQTQCAFETHVDTYKCDFNTHKSDFYTHKSDFHTQSVILYAECDLQAL